MENLKQFDNPQHRRGHHVYNWREFIDALNTFKQRRNAAAFHGECCSQDDQSADSIPWSGSHTYEEALKHLNSGWKFGLDRIAEIRRHIPPDLFDCIMPIQDYKPEMRHTIAGGALDVGSFVAGASPENFVTEVVPADAEQRSQGKKLMTVYVQTANSCFCGWDEFIYRGAYAYALIEHLENCGYSVELWCVAWITWKYPMKVYVKVKEFGELFDNNKMAVTLAAPFFLRRFVFALMECYSDDEVRITHESYGSAMLMKDIDKVVLPDDMDLNPLWIPTVNIATHDKTLEEYRKILDNYIGGNVVQE
jgi:hypothetical protein